MKQRSFSSEKIGIENLGFFSFDVSLIYLTSWEIRDKIWGFVKLSIAFSQQVYSIQLDNYRKVRFDFQLMELS